MKIGLFADIHGNLPAFELVFEQLREAALDRYIFCGDLCGYYYDQNAVVDMLERLDNLVAVMGNHDLEFLQSLTSGYNLTPYTERYGTSLQTLRERVTPKTLEFLRRLPDRFVDDELGLAAFHGSPWNPYHEYVYPTDSIDRFEGLPWRYVVLGHTHYAMERRTNGTLIINPGSCGQPRDSRAASYAILDVDRGEVTVHRVAYDPAPLLQEIERRHETNPYLARVLQR